MDLPRQSDIGRQRVRSDARGRVRMEYTLSKPQSRVTVDLYLDRRGQDRRRLDSLASAKLEPLRATVTLLHPTTEPPWTLRRWAVVSIVFFLFSVAQ